jgi:hypothetical protein
MHDPNGSVFGKLPHLNKLFCKVIHVEKYLGIQCIKLHGYLRKYD